MNTPDTEWEKTVEEYAKDWLFAGDEPKSGDENVYKEFVTFLTEFLSSRDTYWKERVRDVKFDIEALRGSPRDTDIEYARAITDVHKILDDIIDNLK